MKSYKEYEKRNIGASDIASLILSSPEKVEYINFGEDGLYSAYIVDEKAEIGSHYKKVFECEYWLKIYDDFDLTLSLHGSKINVYRAGNFGCIIQIFK